MEEKSNNTLKIILVIVAVIIGLGICIAGVVFGLGALGVATINNTASVVESEAKDVAAKAEIQNIQSALEQYRANNGEYPSSIEMIEGDYMVSINIQGEKPEYKRISKHEYTLSVELPSGEMYEVSSN
jgi:hypothetical protein